MQMSWKLYGPLLLLLDHDIHTDSQAHFIVDTLREKTMLPN